MAANAPRQKQFRINKLDGACAKGVQVAKPEDPKALVVIIGNLISVTPSNGPIVEAC
jgi:hypothetical protein